MAKAPIDFAREPAPRGGIGREGAGPRRAHFRRDLRLHRYRLACSAACSRPTFSSSPGRPGMGKTSLATNMAFHAARAYVQDMEAGAEVPRGAPVLFFSLEMAAQQLSARILSEQTEIEMWKIRNGKFSESEWEKFVLTMQELSTLPLYIDDTGGISIAQIAARARRLKREKKIGLHHHRLSAAGRAVAPRREPGAGNHRGHQGAQGPGQGTERAGAGAVAAVARRRRRDDKRPVLSDLRESGSIEQDADVVMFVYREEYYLKSREPDPGSRRSRQMAGEMRARASPRRSAGGKAPPRRDQQDRPVFRRPLHALLELGGGGELNPTLSSPASIARVARVVREGDPGG